MSHIKKSRKFTDCAKVFEVKPEIRTAEHATFTVADERFVYNSQFSVSISKAGLFSVRLRLPEGFDIDTLTAPEPQLSHWDETSDGDERIATVHFTKKVLGEVGLDIALSKPVDELQRQLTVPRIEAIGSEAEWTGPNCTPPIKVGSLSVVAKA